MAEFFGKSKKIRRLTGKNQMLDYLLELMRHQGTARHLRLDSVSDEHLEKILQAARWAPSGANTQPWDFVIVKDSRIKEKIAQIFASTYEKAKRMDKKFPYHDPKGLHSRFTTPPVLIAVCADSRLMKAYPKVSYREEILNVSMGVAIQNMMLAANALGLALSWGTLDTLKRDKLRKLLGVPTSIRVLEALQLGYPTKRVRPSYRRSYRDFTHSNKFDISKLRSEKEIRSLLSTRINPNIYSGVHKRTRK